MNVARDIKVRQLEEHAKSQADFLAAARWEVAVSEKDEVALRKRVDAQIREDTKLAKISNTALRRSKLEALYQQDELRYEDELNMRGLAFRREHI